MKRILSIVAVVVMGSVMAWANCGSCPGDKAATACCKASDTVYVCATCSTCDVKAGKCAKCDQDLKAMHVLAMKDGSVTLCPCESGCKCTLKADDPTQCSCGKAVVTVKCQGSCPVSAPKAETR